MAKRWLVFSIGFVRCNKSGKITQVVCNGRKAYHQRKVTRKNLLK